jgi:WD40 repeat protein/DNA-binding SARP family transcriptional activator
MGVRMLGPVAVGGDGGRLAPRDRVVLAALAMGPGEVVTPDRLADALWPGVPPPPTWIKIIQGSIMRIRKALGAAAVRTTRQGYVLDLPDGEIDGVRFEQLLRRGRELMALHEPDRARFVMNQALDLWYGPALAELAGWPPGAEAAEHWEELRRDAEELRVEAALASGGWREVLTEAGRLVGDQPFRENRWALLARAQYQAGRQGEALATLQRARAVLAGELGLDPGPDLVALEESILHQDPDLIANPVSSRATVDCPYRGLLAYDVDDAEQYFGRDADVAACHDVLAREHVVAIVGPSGSGKSSLARAGIAAALRSEGRTVTVMTPGPHPMAALEQAGGLRRRVVLVVDQLEEVVTLCEEETERTAFLDVLAGHAETGAELVLTLRADRLAALSGHQRFARVLERGLHLLGPMGEDDLRSAIEGPARQAGLLLEPGLVDLLLHEVSGEPGALPLLSHALAETWERREGRTLTVGGYQASGGIQGAVARSAEHVFLSLGEGEQRSARTLLLRLVVPQDSGEPTRSRIPRRLVAPDASHEEIVEMLVAARLVTSDGETIELAHESLARAWPRLRGWLDSDTEGQLILRHLTTAADSWEAMGRPGSELYRGTRLAQALEWHAASSVELTRTEREFLDASQSLAKAEARSAEQRLHEQARSNRRLRGLLAGVAALLVTALVAGGLALRESRRADTQADLATVRELASASRAVGTEDPELAVLLALEATAPTLAGDDPPREAVEALHTALVSSRLEMVVEDAGGTVAWSPDGGFLVTEGPENTGLVELYDATTGEKAVSFTGHEIDVNDVAFGPDGQLATSGDDGAVRVWDPASEELLVEVEGEGGVWRPSFATRGPTRFAAIWEDEQVIRVATVASRGEVSVTEIPTPGWVGDAELSPDGTWLAAVAGRAAIVDVETGEPRHFLGRDDALTVAISPDGRWVAVGTSSGDVRIHDAATGRGLHTISEAESGAISLAWSADSRRLAVGEVQGDVQVHDVTPTGVRSSLSLSSTLPSGWMTGLAFSPDGTRLLGGDAGVTLASVWDVGLSGDAEVRNVRGARESNGLAFGPDGRLFTIAEGGSVHIHDAGGEGSAPGPTAMKAAGMASDAFLQGLAVSPDGGTVGIGDSPLGAQVWDVASRDLLFHTDSEEFTWRPAFSPDSRLVALATESRIDLYRPDGEREARLEPEDGFGFRDPAFSPDGTVVAALSFPLDREDPEGWRVVLWDWESGEVSRVPTRHGLDPEFSPDGTQLVIAAVGAPTRVLDVASGDVVHTLTGHATGVMDATFSPDGRLIATGGRDGLAIIWDAEDGTPVLQLPRSDHEVSSVAFSADGRHLATDSIMTDVVRVWTLDAVELRRIAADQLARDFTSAECRRYLHRACDSA